jgi:hypothetical protein
MARADSRKEERAMENETNTKPECSLLLGLDEHELETLETCKRILEANEGDNTAVENLILGLIDLYRIRNGAVMPKDVTDAVDVFQESFATLVGDARRMLANYPELFRPGAGGAAQQQRGRDNDEGDRRDDGDFHGRHRAEGV